jgi:molybdopterin-synthase adenylyltransferase
VISTSVTAAQRPALKRYARTQKGDSVVLTREPGVETTISDPTHQVADLLDLLTGELTVEEIVDAMRARWPELTRSDVETGISALEREGLVEDAAAVATTLEDAECERYESNLAFFSTFAGFDQSRYEFQEQLRAAHVLLLGVGGLGSTILFNLVGLGLGKITIVDSDTVELSNLSRQFLYAESDLGKDKLARAAARAASVNSTIDVVPVELRISQSGDLAGLLDGVDIVLSAIDRPEGIQYQVNDACVRGSVPYVNGAVWATRGYYYSIWPGHGGCLRCHESIRDREHGDDLPRWPELINRATGPSATLMGGLVSLEALRYLTGFAAPAAAAKVWVADFLGGSVTVAYEWSRLEECPVCGMNAPETFLS